MQCSTLQCSVAYFSPVQPSEASAQSSHLVSRPRQFIAPDPVLEVGMVPSLARGRVGGLLEDLLSYSFITYCLVLEKTKYFYEENISSYNFCESFN